MFVKCMCTTFGHNQSIANEINKWNLSLTLYMSLLPPPSGNKQNLGLNAVWDMAQLASITT